MKKALLLLCIGFLVILGTVSASCFVECESISVCTEYTPGYNRDICTSYDYWYECDGIKVTPTHSTTGDTSISNLEVVGCECVVYTITNTRSADASARSYYHAYDTIDGSKGSTPFTQSADSVRREQIQYMSFEELGNSQYEATWTFHNGLSGTGNPSSAILDCYMAGCGNDILDDGEECEQDSACLPTSCDQLDACVGLDFHDYEALPNTCNECACTSNECIPTIHENNEQCRCKTDADCILPEIQDCNYNPDNNPFKLDYAPQVQGVCDPIDDCQFDPYQFTHECDKTQCGAECETDIDCACPNDGCIDSDNDEILDDFATYPEYNACQNDCSCTPCQPTTISNNDDRCKTAMKIPIDQYVSMFSLPLIPDTPVTFNDIQNGCTFRDNITYGITYWDPFKEGDDKYVYIDANTILYPGQGYFTSQENECEFTLEGYKFTTDFLGYLGSNNAYIGWNMIGVPSVAIDNFNLIKGTCNIISGPWGFDAPNYEFVRTQRLEPGKGYFAKTTNDCNLEFKGG